MDDTIVNSDIQGPTEMIQNLLAEKMGNNGRKQRREKMKVFMIRTSMNVNPKCKIMPNLCASVW